MAVDTKIAFARILADLNLAVRYGIAIRTYVSRKFWRIFYFGGCNIDRQTAKFNSPPSYMYTVVILAMGIHLAPLL